MDFILEVYIGIAIAAAAVGWLGIVWWSVIEAEDLFEAAVMSMLGALCAPFIALVWPLALIFGGMWWLVHQ